MKSNGDNVFNEINDSTRNVDLGVMKSDSFSTTFILWEVDLNVCTVDLHYTSLLQSAPIALASRYFKRN